MKRILFVLSALLPLFSRAQVPNIELGGVYEMTNSKGEVQSDSLVNLKEPLQAPVKIKFFVDIDNETGYTMTGCKWTVTNQTNTDFTTLWRTTAEFQEDFVVSGSYQVKFEAVFRDEATGDEYVFPEEGEDPKTLSFTISESKLEFPNAFSPNGDEKNDILKPIGERGEGYRSIVAFHAAVFNRWGKKLYVWDDIDGGWDGKVGGKPVKDGVYFLVVSAKGADGINYNIKKAINVLTGYNEGEGNGNGAGE